jgi:hypothetical protein
MPREEEVNDIPEPRQYEVLPEGSYTGHIWEKKPRITRNKRDGSGTFEMWPLSFRITHKASGEELRKPVIVYTDFFESQMIKLQAKVGGHPIQGKPVLVDVVIDEYDSLGDVETNEDGTFKTEFDGKVKRKKTKRQVSRIDRGEGGRGEPVVDLNPKGKVITLDTMDIIDLEEGRTRDVPDAQPEEDLPF